LKKIKPKYLIIGGAGFIGRSLAKSFKASDTSVFIFDKKDKLKKFQNELKKFKKYEGDIKYATSFKKLKHQFDKIFFFAAEPSTYICEKYPNKFLNSNIIGLLNFKKWCEKSKPKEIIFSSSMGVYGDVASNAREASSTNPISNYGSGKLFGENLLLQLKKIGINIVILRFFNVYGPGQDFKNMNQGMLSIYLSQIFKHKKVFVKGSLNRFRDLVFIDDVIRACKIRYLKRNENVYNVGSGVKTTVKNLLNKLFNQLNLPVNIQVLDGHKGDSFGTFANIEKLKKRGWEPKINLDEGIEKTINWLKAK